MKFYLFIFYGEIVYTTSINEFQDLLSDKAYTYCGALDQLGSVGPKISPFKGSNLK